MGSSAGGHPLRVSTGFGIQTIRKSMSLTASAANPISRSCSTGLHEQGGFTELEFTVSNALSPTLIVSAKDDKGFSGSVVYAKALKEAGASVRVHFFERSRISLRPKEYRFPWPDLCLQWFRDNDLIQRKPSHRIHRASCSSAANHSFMMNEVLNPRLPLQASDYCFQRVALNQSG